MRQNGAPCFQSVGNSMETERNERTKTLVRNRHKNGTSHSTLTETLGQ